MKKKISDLIHSEKNLAIETNFEKDRAKGYTYRYVSVGCCCGVRSMWPLSLVPHNFVLLLRQFEHKNKNNKHTQARAHAREQFA